MNEIECIALYGKIDWNINDVHNFITGMKSIFSLLNVTATQYGYCETPFQKYGSRMGSVRNENKKVDSLYADGLKLKTLEFFSLPKGYGFQYADYIAYFARGIDYLVIAYDTTQCNAPDPNLLMNEMRKHISAVWGEYFRIPKGEQPLTHCMDAFSRNPLGCNFPENENSDGVQIIDQFVLLA